MSDQAEPQGSAERIDPTKEAAKLRLHPLTPLALGVRILGILLIYVLLSSHSFTGQKSSGSIYTVLAFAGVFALVLLRGVVTLLTTSYWTERGELRVDSGLLARQSKHVRLDRVQSVDVLRPFSARLFGLAEVRVSTAGTEKSTVRLRFLGEGVARALRANLLARTSGLDVAVVEAVEEPLVIVPARTLVAAELLALLSWRLVFLFVGPVLTILSVSGNGHHGAAPIVGVALIFSTLFVLGQTIWRRVTTLWNFTVAESPDGLRIRHGLLSTSSQTVPFGRIQAIRVHQPLLWRPFGWATIHINVAGYAGKREGNNTTLLPVAPKEFAEWLVARVLGGVDINTVSVTRPPKRASFRAPFWWRFEAAGSSDQFFVARHGMFSRTIKVVPHARTQSVRLITGPWQRALGLASVHLDSTRGPVRIRASFRDASEARGMLDAQAARAHQARGTAPD